MTLFINGTMRYVCLVFEGLRVLHTYVSGFQFAFLFLFSFSCPVCLCLVCVIPSASPVCLISLCFVYLSPCLFIPLTNGWGHGTKNPSLPYLANNKLMSYIQICQIRIKHNIQFLFRKVNKGNLHLKTASKYFFL